MPATEQKRPPKLARTGFGPRVEIERAIFAELCQQLGMRFSWPEQSGVSELERQKTIEREQIAAQIVSHDECGGLRVRAEIFREL
jgi:hypothetical protein